MNIGELFVNLGVKGSEKTLGALTGVKKGLGEAKSMSIEAKAAIVGAVYALERLFAASGAMGTSLTNFNALTGLSAKQLQQWQYAARQAGVANEEFTGSIKSVQNSMTNMLLGKGAPEGLAMVAQKVGFDPKRARDTFYVLEQLQKFARSAPADVGNSVLKSFGLGEGTIAAMRRNAFTPDVMSKAPTYNDSQIQALDKANIAWSNLGSKIEMAVGKFNAKHGLQLVRDISMVTDQVLKLIEAFVGLADKLKIFSVIGKVFEGWTSIFKGVSEGVEGLSTPKKREELGKDVMGFFKEMPGVFKAMSEDLFGAPEVAPSGAGGATIVMPKGKGIPSASRSAAPQVPPLQLSPGSTQNINVNQNLNFQHDGKEHKKTSDSVKKATQDAFRQYSQGQVS